MFKINPAYFGQTVALDNVIIVFVRKEGVSVKLLQTKFIQDHPPPPPTYSTYIGCLIS